MVEPRMGKDFETGAHRAALWVVGAVHKARYARLDHRPGAHDAGLDGDIQRGVGEAVVAEQARGFAKDDDFRVRGWIIFADGAVAGTSKDLVTVDNDRADWNYPSGSRSASFRKCFLHKLDVGFHVRRENSMNRRFVRSLDNLRGGKHTNLHAGTA